MKQLLSFLTPAKGGLVTALWRVFAFALIFVAYIIWPMAGDPLERGLVAMALIAIAGCILQWKA